MINDDYDFGSDEQLPQGRDLRKDYRLTARARAWIEFECDEPEGETMRSNGPSGSFECQVRDISAGGFSFVTEHASTPGSIFAAQVCLGEGERVFRLIVEVVWCRSADYSYLVGVHLLESDETDYPDWMDAVARALAAP